MLPEKTVLLLDQHTVAKTTNLTQRFYPARRHARNPVMRRTEKWEGVGPYVWGNRLMQDERTRELRLWYVAYDFAGNFYRWGYATSRDALHWTKPDLKLERFGDGLATNCLPLGPHPDKGTRSIARDPRAETPPERRYLGVRFTYAGEFVSFSPDGLAWQEHPANPVWFVPSDIIHVMWDDRRDRFTAYFKVWEVRGTEVKAGAADRPFLAHMPFYDVKNLSNETAEFEGPCIEFRASAAAEVKKRKFVLRAGNQGPDDGGGASLSGAWVAKRVQCWAESDDGVHWRNEQVVVRADERDPATANVQFMFVMRYGGYYLGFLTLHDAAGAFRIQFAWSADGMRWNRTAREPWLDIGPPGAFDSGMVLGPADPVFWQREMWFPYGGFPIRHDSRETNWESAIGLATMRLDGFAAWEPNGKGEGELLTQPFRCTGGGLWINADAATGSVRVEVLEGGIPLKGFEAGSCRPVKGDVVGSAADRPVEWTTGADISTLQGRLIQLRCILRDARLFAFRTAASSSTPRATTR